ncbi:MAG TPA: hypothetical protein VEH28_07075 [Thermoplasmata archaeon]|nr:hypothetical protein [Thermoplasmata archaeon]
MPPPPPPGPSRTFVILTFAVAILVGASIVYLGVTGQIGAGIP